MILSSKVIIGKPRGKSYTYYKNLGYDLSLNEVVVLVKHLPKYSEVKVEVKCDYCSLIKNIPYSDYVKTTDGGNKKYACINCSPLKFKEGFKERYGVENPFQLDSVKVKIKEKNRDKYGLDYHTQSNYIKDKIKGVIKERYGVDNISQLDFIKEKVKKTNLEKFGSDYIFNSDLIRSNNKIDSDINHVSYLGSSQNLFKCDKGHDFEISKNNYYGRLQYNTSLCTICNPIGENRSIKEKELHDFIKSIYNGKVIQSYKDSLEIDTYLPDLKIGFEFNGLHWNSELYKDKFYHLNKTKYFTERGIRIIHIWEDDWDFRKNIIKSQIRNWLGLTEKRIFARNCQVRVIKDSREVTKFLDENHIQGNVRSNLKLGLYHKEELVSLMTFDHYEGRKKISESEWNINRFCSKKDYNVIGGASKLFKHFINNYDVSRILSYADRDWSMGKLYETLGFEKVNESHPDYKYHTKGHRVNKSRFRKSLTMVSENDLGIPKIWDCGKIKFELLIKILN